MSEEQQFYGQAPEQVKPEDFLETPQYKSAEYGQNQAGQPAAPSEPQGTRQVLETLASKGYDVSQFSSDEDLIQETESQYAAAAQERAALEREKQQLLHQQQIGQAPQQPEPEMAPEPETGGKPEFDPNWANLVEPDETGRYVVRDEYIGSVDQSIADKVNNYAEWRQKRSNDLIDDPVSAVIEAGLGDQIDARIRSAISSEISQRNIQQQAQDFIQQNADALYVKNPQTGDFQKDSNGNPVLSAAGQALNNAHVTLREQGMYDPVARHQVAMQMVQNQITQSQLAAMQQSQQPQQSVSQSFKDQYTDQPFAQPTNPLPPGQMPNTPVQPTANALGANGLPEHNSLGSLATALAVHKGYLQQKGQRGDLIWLNLQQY